jgi:hypothetical protein
MNIKPLAPPTALKDEYEATGSSTCPQGWILNHWLLHLHSGMDITPLAPPPALRDVVPLTALRDEC